MSKFCLNLKYRKRVFSLPDPVTDPVNDKKHSNFFTLLSQTFEDTKENIGEHGNDYLKNGYNELSYLTDFAKIFELDKKLNLNLDLKSLISEQLTPSIGRPLEVSFVVAKESEGIVAIAADGIYHGADLVTNKAVYNLAYSRNTIAGKLNPEGKRKLDSDGNVVTEISNLERVAQAVKKAKEDGLDYKFVIADNLSFDLSKGLTDLNNMLGGIKITEQDIILHKFK